MQGSKGAEFVTQVCFASSSGPKNRGDTNMQVRILMLSRLVLVFTTIVMMVVKMPVMITETGQVVLCCYAKTSLSLLSFVAWKPD